MTYSLGSGQEKPNTNMETCVGKEWLVGQTVTDGNLLLDCEWVVETRGSALFAEQLSSPSGSSQNNNTSIVWQATPASSTSLSFSLLSAVMSEVHSFKQRTSVNLSGVCNSSKYKSYNESFVRFVYWLGVLLWSNITLVASMRGHMVPDQVSQAGPDQ